MTVGEIIRRSLLAGKSNKEALAAVYTEVGDAKTTLNTVRWVRNQMRSKEKVPGIMTAREIAKYRKEMNLPEEGDEVEILYEKGVLKRSKKGRPFGSHKLDFLN